MTRRLHTLLGGAGHAIAVSLVLASPAVSQACAVCMSGRDDENRTAFIAMTAFMTTMPFLLIGGIVFWLWRRAKAMALEEAAAESQNTAAGPIPHASPTETRRARPSPIRAEG